MQRITLFNDGTGWAHRKKRHSKRRRYYNDFLFEKKKHPSLSNRVLWKIVYDNNKK
jgi:hypothetical protein